jgi:hypothetical protein
MDNKNNESSSTSPPQTLARTLWKQELIQKLQQIDSLAQDPTLDTVDKVDFIC